MCRFLAYRKFQINICYIFFSQQHYSKCWNICLLQVKGPYETVSGYEGESDAKNKHSYFKRGPGTSIKPWRYFFHWTKSSLWQLEHLLAPHSSTLAWKIPRMEEPGGLQSMGSLRVRHDWATSLSLSCIGEGNGNPLQCSCLENPRDGEAWWAAIYGVAQSRTRLKRLSSSSSSSRSTLLPWTIPWPQFLTSEKIS